MGYYGVIYVNGAPPLIATTAYRIFSELKAKREVKLNFSRYKGSYSPVHERIKVSSLEALFKK